MIDWNSINEDDVEATRYRPESGIFEAKVRGEVTQIELAEAELDLLTRRRNASDKLSFIAIMAQRQPAPAEKLVAQEPGLALRHLRLALKAMQVQPPGFEAAQRMLPIAADIDGILRGRMAS